MGRRGERAQRSILMISIFPLSPLPLFTFSRVRNLTLEYFKFPIEACQITDRTVRHTGHYVLYAHTPDTPIVEPRFDGNNIARLENVRHRGNRGGLMDLEPHTVSGAVEKPAPGGIAVTWNGISPFFEKVAHSLVDLGKSHTVL